MLATVGIIALNEENNIGELFNNILNQTYNKKLIEVVLVDSGSTDNTKEMMLNFKNNYQEEFYGIKVLDNEKKIQASGWNVVIKNATGDVIIRVDAHAVITSDFVENNINCIMSGESVCGGQRINIIKGDKLINKALLEAENSMFGSSIASYRKSLNNEKKYVSTVAHACYKKEVFEKVGMFDETLLRSEDNDMHYRIREAGYKICYNSNILSYYQSRSSIKSSLKQKYSNGEWIGITSCMKTPKMFSIYHFIPLLFVIAILATTILSIISPALGGYLRLLFNLPTILMWGAYFILLLAMLIITSVKTKRISIGILSIVLVFLFHISYGLGTIVGIFKGVKRR